MIKTETRKLLLTQFSYKLFGTLLNLFVNCETKTYMSFFFSRVS